MRERFSASWVQEQVEKTISVWQEGGRAGIPAGREFTAIEQASREEAYDEALFEVEQELDAASSTKRTDCPAIERRVLNAFARFSANALHLEPEAIRILNDDFIPIGLQLSVWARRFDSRLSMASIVQACRNAWTACGMQPLLGVPVKLTSSILGYSLLYPYSDNLLDQEGLPQHAKLRFSQRFLTMLRGESLPAKSHREAAIAALISLIEGEYPRSRYPEVFDSLIAIHQAQENSIRQVGEGQSLQPVEILPLSCQKGGTSVLADACLARPELSAQETSFAFEWGVLLQLGDDLQDLQDDLNRSSMTLFSLAASSGKSIDSLAAQLLHFGENVGRSMDSLPNGTASLKELLKMSWRSLIVGAVAESSTFFSTEFLAKAERASPFRFSFLRARRERISAHGGLYAKLFERLLRARVAAAPYIDNLGARPAAAPLPSLPLI